MSTVRRSPKKVKQLLANLGQLLASARDLEGGGERYQMLADGSDLVAVQVAHDEGVVQREDLAVDMEDRLASLIGDVGVLAQVEELLADDVAHRRTSSSSANGRTQMQPGMPTQEPCPERGPHRSGD
jgi:hypothetical protein